MAAFWVIDYLCLAGVLGGAILVVRLRNLTAAVIALSTLTLFMSLLFVLLSAPDDALSEITVGTIVLPVLYLVAIGKARASVPDGGGMDNGGELHRVPIGLLVAVATAGLLAVALLALPRESAALPEIARRAMLVALPHWHTTEVVTEVVFGTRGFDTFGETFLLLAAVTSVVLFTRTREGRRGFVGESRSGAQEQAEQDPRSGPTQAERAARETEACEWDERRTRDRQTPDDEGLATPGPETSESMSVVVRIAVRALAPALATAGCYLFAESYSPGGGFPGGAIVVGVVLFVYAGLGYRRIARGVRVPLMEVIEQVGALAIIAIETLGLILAGSISANWIHLAPEETLRSGGILQAFNVGEFVEVGAGLIIAIFAIMTMRHDWAPEPETEAGSQPESPSEVDS